MTVLAASVAILSALAGQTPSRELPLAQEAPVVGEKMPDFSLPGVSGRTVQLSKFIAAGRGGKPGWVLLVFYRGYW